MTKNDLIAKQQLEIEILKKRLQWAKKDKHDIAMSLVYVGGPLNDNILGYTKKQQNFLQEILRIAERGDHEEIPGE